MTGLDFDLFYTNKVIKVVQTTTCDFLYCNRSYKLGHGNSLWSSHLTNEIQKVLRFEQTSRNDLDDLFTWRNFKTRELSLVHSHKLKTGSDRKCAKVWSVNTKKIFFFKLFHVLSLGWAVSGLEIPILWNHTNTFTVIVQVQRDSVCSHYVTNSRH